MYAYDVHIFTYFTRLARVLYQLSISNRKRAATMLLSYILEKITRMKLLMSRSFIVVHHFRAQYSRKRR